MFNLKSQPKIHLALDLGNRLIKSCTTNGTLKTLSSWYKDLEEWDNPKPDTNSVIIHDEKGDNPNIVKKYWAVGYVAQDLGGHPTFESEKAFLAPKLALAMIEGGSGITQVTVERLVCALPNELQDEKVQPETLGAFKWVLSHKLFRYARINGILDLGGKTGIGQLYTKNGTLIRELRIIVGGTYQLAQLIAQHPKLIFRQKLRQTKTFA